MSDVAKRAVEAPSGLATQLLEFQGETQLQQHHHSRPQSAQWTASPPSTASSRRRAQSARPSTTNRTASARSTSSRRSLGDGAGAPASAVSAATPPRASPARSQRASSARSSRTVSVTSTASRSRPATATAAGPASRRAQSATGARSTQKQMAWVLSFDSLARFGQTSQPFTATSADYGRPVPAGRGSPPRRASIHPAANTGPARDAGAGDGASQASGGMDTEAMIHALLQRQPGQVHAAQQSSIQLGARPPAGSVAAMDSSTSLADEGLASASEPPLSASSRSRASSVGHLSLLARRASVSAKDNITASPSLVAPPYAGLGLGLSAPVPSFSFLDLSQTSTIPPRPLTSFTNPYSGRSFTIPKVAQLQANSPYRRRPPQFNPNQQY